MREGEILFHISCYAAVVSENLLVYINKQRLNICYILLVLFASPQLKKLMQWTQLVGTCMWVCVVVIE